MKRLEGRFSSLNGEQFRRAVIAGARRVIAYRDVLDRINVFPVPDADTGSNLAATMNAVIRGLRAPDPSLAAASASVAASALSGARGNSGVIMAQFFQGLHEGIADSVQISIGRFVAAVRRAAQSAREALSRPEEGTILTVMSDFTDHIERRASHINDFRLLMADGLHAARRSLARTVEQLTPLRRAGVVDAGALGFVRFLEGVVQSIHGAADQAAGIVHEEEREARPMPAADFAPERVEFRYCTEAVVHGRGIDPATVRQRLAPFGDSIVVAGTARKIRVHIHTNAPAHVQETLARVGSLELSKVEDMFAQLAGSAGSAIRSGIALVTDSVCDLPQSVLTRSRIQVVPLRIAFETEEFRDRVDITPTGFYRRLADSQALPVTSQPTPAEFLTLYRYLSRYYRGILSVHLSSGVSGTVGLAASAARRVSEETGVPIEVVDTGVASAAEGLCVWAASRAIEAGRSLSECRDAAEAAAQTARVFVFVPSVEYFVRGGRLSRTQGRLADLLRLKPILTMRDGRVSIAGKTIGRRHAMERTFARAVTLASGMRAPAFVVAHSAAPELAKRYAEDLGARFPDATVMIADAAPALGSHAGPGGAAIAVSETGRLGAEARPVEVA
jgi:uncharacterized protein